MRTVATAVAALLAVSLTGCVGGTPEPTTSPTSADASPTPTAEPTPTPSAAFTIPECEILLPIADARAAFSDSTEFLGEVGGLHSRFELPEVQAAFVGADPAQGCSWGIPNSDGSFTVGVAWLDDVARAGVEAALLDTGVLAVTMGTVTGYDLEGESMVSSIAETHLFTGGLWIVVGGTTLGSTGVIAATVLDSMRTANPTLGL